MLMKEITSFSKNLKTPWRSIGIALLACGFAPIWSAAAPHPADEAMVNAVKRVLPAVVNINTEELESTRIDPLDALFYEYFGSAPAGVPAKRKVQSLGSGFFVDPAGYILTNYHVVARSAQGRIHVTTQNQQNLEARFVTGDPYTDLALLRVVGSEPFPSLNAVDISENLLGQTVIVVGNPFGIGSTITRGVLSAVDREVTLDGVTYSKLVQSDASINPGNSGGPMVDLHGRLVGVSSVKMAFTPQGVPAAGIGFAVPASLVKVKLAEFLATASRLRESEVAQPVSAAWVYFGMHLQDSKPGPVVAQIDPAGPADRAGLKAGMRITRVGKYDVSESAACESILSRVRQGVVVDFGVVAQGASVEKPSVVRITAR